MKMKIFIIMCFSFLLASETTAIYRVDGMMCGKNCPIKIKESLNGIDGVKKCQVDFTSKTATVTFDDKKISRDEIAKTIAKKTHFKVKDSEKRPWSLFGWLFGKS